MKKTMLSLSLAVLVMAGAQAQQTALDQAADRVQQIMDADRQSGTGSTSVTIALTDSTGKALPAFQPRRSSTNNGGARTNNGAVAQQRTTNTGATTQPNAGVVFIPGQIYEINGQSCMLGADGKFYPVGGGQQQQQQAPVQQQVPNPNNNTGPAVAGTLSINPVTGEAYAYDPVTGWKVLTSPGAASGGGASGGAGGSGYDPNDATKALVVVKGANGRDVEMINANSNFVARDEPEVLTVRPNQQVWNRQGDGVAEQMNEERTVRNKRTRRLFNSENDPTPGSASAVASMNGGGNGGFVGAGVGIGVGVNCAPGFNPTALYGTGACAPVSTGWLVGVGPQWMRR